jgi:hypothetical protein
MLKWVEITLMLNYDKILHIFYIEIVDIMLKSKYETFYVEIVDIMLTSKYKTFYVEIVDIMPKSNYEAFCVWNWLIFP